MIIVFNPLEVNPFPSWTLSPLVLPPSVPTATHDWGNKIILIMTTSHLDTGVYQFRSLYKCPSSSPSSNPLKNVLNHQNICISFRIYIMRTLYICTLKHMHLAVSLNCTKSLWSDSHLVTFPWLNIPWYYLVWKLMERIACCIIVMLCYVSLIGCWYGHCVLVLM